MADASEAVFDKIMESVGDSGPFQKRFNYVFNVGAVICASMAFMNVILAMNVPDHWCHVPGRENSSTSLDVMAWKNLTLPKEIDNRGVETFSSCRMYNFSSITELTEPGRNLTELEIDCTHGYVYDDQWYDKTAVSQEDWVCQHDMYATNTFAFHRVGELVGTMIFGQLGDILGRKPIFYISTLTIILGRLVSVMVTQYYVIFSIVSVINMLTSISIFQAPLIIAMEVSKGEDRAHIAMNQYLGWTLGMCIMPMVFWLVRDWVWFLLITTLPCGIFLFFPRYMLESPRWLANKGHFKRCAETLAQIAKINGKNVEYTEKSLKELMKDNKIESVYGMASLFTHWRLAKNTALIVVCWSVASLVYFTLILNASKMPGNPFLNFMWQSIVEMPAYMLGRVFGDKIGRRFTISLSFLIAALACMPIVMTINQPEYDYVTLVFVVIIKFCGSITFYVVNLHAMETYPTCLRQTGLSIGSICANFLGVLGPYIVYLGTNYDVKYPYLILFVLLLVGAAAGLHLPETLHQRLPESMVEAQRFGKDQKFWSWPRPEKSPKTTDAELEKLNQPEHKS